MPTSSPGEGSTGSRSLVGVAPQAARDASPCGAFLPRHASRARVSFGPLVSAGWLREHIGDRDVTVIDFRWYLIAGRAQGPLPDSNDRDADLPGHIPRA